MPTLSEPFASTCAALAWDHLAQHGEILINVWQNGNITHEDAFKFMI